jgi:LPS sulfotransferase NodH
MTPMIKNRIRRAIIKSGIYLREWGLDPATVIGSYDYTRFVILGRSRVGSNLLRGLLNSHSGIWAYGELFRDYQFIGWGFPDYPQLKSTLALIQKDPVAFLENKVFRKYPKYVSAVGFKLFYYHAQEDGRERVWEYLRNDKDIRIIHIKRRNILKTHLSRQRALISGKWANVTGVTKENAPISLSYEDCIADFVRTREWEAQYDRLFESHPKMDINYEDLAKDYVGEMKHIQKFLSVEFEELQPSTYKQSGQPLSDAISNYFELKMGFAGSPWEVFFEE